MFHLNKELNEQLNIALSELNRLKKDWEEKAGQSENIYPNLIQLTLKCIIC